MKLRTPQKIALHLIVFGLGLVLGYFTQILFPMEMNPILQWGIITVTSIAGVVGVVFKLLPFLVNWHVRKREERNQDIQRLIRHTIDLIPELENWSKNHLVSSSEYLFALTQKHVKYGYTELWNILEGNNGERQLRLQYDALRWDIHNKIETTISEQVLQKFPKLKMENLSLFVEDTREFIERRLYENKLYVFEVFSDTSVTPHKHSIRSLRSNGSNFRKEYQVATKCFNGRSEDDFTKIVEIMNNTQLKSELEDMVKDYHIKGEKLGNKRVSFDKKIKQIIDNINFAVADKDKILLGTCKKCRSIKEKWEID